MLRFNSEINLMKTLENFLKNYLSRFFFNQNLNF
jgi:hypothetical protein